MKKRKWIALMLAAAMAVGSLTACGSSDEGDSGDTTTQSTQGGTSGGTESADGTGYVVPEEPVTIKFLHKGPEPDGWDAVYEKYLEITSGSEWDLVFEASWVQLRNLAPEGYYADLSSYFNNPEEYPGLAAAFSPETMESNIWFDSMCYILLFEVYGNGIPVVWYRLDWAKEWGIGTDGKISSYDEMEQYWQAALDAGKIAYGATQARGFFQQLSLRGEVYPGSAEAGLQQFSSAGLTVWTYTQDNELLAYAVEGSGDEAFADFPEGWQYDFGVDRYEQFAEWQEAGYIDLDSLSCTDATTPFESGLSASMVGTLDDYISMKDAEATLGDGAIGFFVYVDGIRNMEEGAIAVDYSGNNGLCVPANSEKIDYTMKFLDWLFGSQEAHDLFQLGIEGVDFVYGETEGTYETLTSYSADFGGYGWTWNPTYALISTAYEGDALSYREYEYDSSSFSSLPILGFHFDTTDVDLSTAVAQCKAVTDMVSVIKLHGITTDGNGVTYDTMAEMLKANVDSAMENGGQEVVDALIEQLEAFLATKRQ